MSRKIIEYKILAVFVLIVWGIVSLVAGQYYYFDATSATDYPYQQWCTENIYVKATTVPNVTWATAWLFSVQLDPLHFLYYTGSVATDLQANLFVANTNMFLSYTNPLLFPQWIDGGKTILHIDRSNTLSPFVGNLIYGTIKNFIPKYSPSDYTWTFVIVYANDTTQTSLSYGWKNIINSWYQFAHLTWSYYIYQQPCVNDTTAPTATITLPAAGTKQFYLSWVTLTLLENVGDTNVPYVRTGGLPNVGTWTGNTWGINNQYGVDLSTFQLRISWNGTGKYFTGGMFSASGVLSAVASNKSWQFRDKNYSITMSWSQVFDYGIEKTITLTGSVRDRNNNLTTFTRTFNAPVGPTLIAWSRNPDAWANGILATPPVILWIQDDWAGVNSWSIVVTLSWTAWTNYGPYVFSWTSLHLSWVVGVANQPDYFISISSHPSFPSSWTIKVIVYAEDMEWTPDTISDYTFSTKPSCFDLGCCDPMHIQTGTYAPFLYSWFSLTISGGINPTFTFSGATGTINCGTEEQQGTNLYKWTEEASWSAWLLTFFDLPNLILSGYNTVKAILSGQTLYLQSTHIFTFFVSALPSNRVYQDTNNANTWVLKFYDMDRNFVTSSLPFTLNNLGTWEIKVNIASGTYYVIFKWQSHLASYLSGIILTWAGEKYFDFTTGADLYGTQNLDSQTDDGKQYQTAWDLKNIDGDYDFVVNGNDISIMLYDTFPKLWVDVLDPRNLNGDSAINASDLSIIGTNCLNQDIFATAWGLFIWQ